jgi:nucleoside-diphosphate-sugar epimerase
MFRNAAEALKRRGFSHLTYLSSDAVYAWQAAPITETSRIAPADSYGEMHAQREELARCLGRETGKPVAVLRPAAVHGPGDTHHAYGPNRFIQEILLHNQITLFGGGEEIRAHLWEDDCARWILQAASERFEGTLNITPRRAAPFREVAEMVRSLCGTQPSLIHSPRKQDITHRSFDPALREHLWPHLPPLPLEESLSRHWSAQAQAFRVP